MVSRTPESTDRIEPLAPAVEGGRRFSGERKVRLGDVDPTGRLRFDALTRYAQDVSDDDTTDAGLSPEVGWVVRSTVVDQVVPARLAERLRFVTFCSGVGRSWAERRLSVSGEAGARYEIATLWICIDAASGRPRGLTEQFFDIYGPAAAGRKVSPRLINPAMPEASSAPSTRQHHQWQLRTVDYDVFGHVNNAAYWAPVEQWVGADTAARPLRIRLEYGAGLAPGDDVCIVRVDEPAGLRLWWLPTGTRMEPEDVVEAGQVMASAATMSLPDDLYLEPPL